MNKVVTINLNGRAYQLEEAGYDALRAYLDQAAAKLEGNPDKGEIMADFEQAIADKCDAQLKGGKNVMTAAEIESIIKAMGPVDDGKSGESGGESATGSTAQTGAAPKRLYRIQEGEMIRGVCAGIGAYFNIDPTLVRVLFVILTILTGGGFAIVYAILMFVVPIARTADEVAQAHGEAPFTAKDFIDRAKTEYEKFANDPSMNKHEWKQRMREWKREMRANRHAWRDEWRTEQRAMRHDGHWHGGRSVVGGIILFILWLVFIGTVISFLKHGLIFGFAIGVGHPIWITLLFLILIFWVVSLPFRAMMWHRRCGYGYGGHCHGGGGGFLWALVVLGLLFWIASLLFAPVHAAWEQVIAYLQTVR